MRTRARRAWRAFADSHPPDSGSRGGLPHTGATPRPNPAGLPTEPRSLLHVVEVRCARALPLERADAASPGWWFKTQSPVLSLPTAPATQGASLPRPLPACCRTRRSGGGAGRLGCGGRKAGCGCSWRQPSCASAFGCVQAPGIPAGVIQLFRTERAHVRTVAQERLVARVSSLEAHT